MATDMQARQLIKQVPPVSAQLNYEGTDDIIINAGLETSGWEVITNNNVVHLVWRGYIDLAGYTQDELTFFTQAVDVQHGCLDTGSPAILNTINLDLVTTRKLRNNEISLRPGFLGFSGEQGPDIQEVIYGEWRSRVPYTATYGALRLLEGDSFGVGNPTATDRIHITRIFAFVATISGLSFESAGTNFVIGGVTGQEKDLVYIERLRRAYTQDPGRNV
jgi:hypothetical protein